MRKLGKLTLEEQEMDDAIRMATAPEPELEPDFDAITTEMDRPAGEGEGDDVVMFNVPALIRVLEHAREDFEGEDGDTELHAFAEMLTSCCKEKAEPIAVEDLEDMFEEEELDGDMGDGMVEVGEAEGPEDEGPEDDGPPAEFGGDDEADEDEGGDEGGDEEGEEEEEEDDEDEGVEEGVSPEGENISEASKCPKEMDTSGKAKKKKKKEDENC